MSEPASLRPSGRLDLAACLAACGLLLLQQAWAWEAAGHWPLSGDSSLYAFQALHWWGEPDPLFLAHWPDKPPVYIWLQSLALHLGHNTLLAAKSLNVAATALTGLVLVLWCVRLRGWASAALAAGVWSLNPLVLAWAPSGLTDPLMVLWGTAALWLAWEGRWFAAGMLLALALFTRQAGLAYLAILPGVVQVRAQPEAPVGWKPLLYGFAAVAVPVQLWDLARWHAAPSFWALGFKHYAPLRLVPPPGWWSRVLEWLSLTRGLTGHWIGAVAMAVLLIRGVLDRGEQQDRQRWRLGLWMLIAAFGWLAIHAMLSFSIWLRYLLPLVPLLCVALVCLLPGMAKPVSLQGLLLLLAASGVLFGEALHIPRAQHQYLPTGPRTRELAGLPDAVQQLQAAAPPGSVLLEREFSWHYLYLLHGDTALNRHWFADADHLVDLLHELPPGTPVFWMRARRDEPETGRLLTKLAQDGVQAAVCIEINEVALLEVSTTRERLCSLFGS
ncbi:MAG: glycosyltransferase family 39 protein [Caldilineaceae bacterium]|nr:glycosyltransferase family 39 protein [Caldilineaceae bacterium]